MKNIGLKTMGRLGFSAIALAGALFAFYEYKKAEQEKAQKAADEKFLDKHIKDLKAFRIKKKGAVLSIAQEGKGWVLKQPVQDQASWAQISRWMDEITNQKVQEIKGIDEIKWEDWHLSDQAGLVEMDFADGSSLSFSVSEKSSFDGKYFIRKGDRLFVGERYFNNEVNEKNFEVFRSKSLLPAGAPHAEKIQFHGLKGQFTLLWDNYKWSLEGAQENSLPLDFDRLDGWWTDISSLKADSVKEKATNSVLRKYGLNRPKLKIIFHSNFGKDSEEYSLKLSPIKDEKAFVALSHRDFILELSKEDAKLLPLSLDEVLDHSFPFKYEKSRASQIQISAGDQTAVFKKKEGVWAWADPSDSKKSLDNQKIEDILSKISQLKGEKYAPFKKDLKPNRSLQIKDEKGEVLLLLEEMAKAGSHFRVKTNLWHELIFAPAKSIDEIFELGLAVSSAENESQPKEEKPLPPNMK